MSADFPPIRQIGEPFWEIATLFPVQGGWSEQDYLNLDTNRLIEFNDGKLEVLPITTELPQFIAYYLGRLDVPMDDALTVCIFESPRGLQNQVDGSGNLQSSTGVYEGVQVRSNDALQFGS